ncbi:endonuclease 8-like 1 isoform X2 [Tachyglossus aculeatus]|uniref:endonuclease 8-like 1 isoform X2 n=1 Tax=Tachyglossus aculeatus TaxID=9261 RepID=UPI0018F3600B|nr:endonuclease 8-like 1 isoform X2 [Tachyglossus aculeatus]
MPEGPELYLAGRFVNEACRGLVFTGPVEKSSVSRNPEVPFCSSSYCISAASRGKEVKLTLTPLTGTGPTDLVFRFGMSGSFRLVPADALPRHAHLRFYTAGPCRRALCFVDVRRFGRWEVQGTWQAGRGPCVLQEYQKFRENVLQNLEDKVFNKPICEALLDQRFFNGIGNYLRAEILYRLRIPPFEKARTVLEALRQRRLSSELTLSQKVKAKLQNPDLLELCHTVPMEVTHLGKKRRGSRPKGKARPDPNTTDAEDTEPTRRRNDPKAGRRSSRKPRKETVGTGTPGPEERVEEARIRTRSRRKPTAPEDSLATGERVPPRPRRDSGSAVRRRKPKKEKANELLCPPSLPPVMGTVPA